MWIAAVGLALTNFLVILDTTITNVSVPHIAGGLAISPAQGTWTITSYAVAEAITVPLSGWLAGRFGTLRTAIGALLGFGLFSVLCGMARTIEVLVLMRVLQGLCGGPLMPMTQTMLLRVFPREKMGIANALWAATAVSAPIFGPLAGGLIADNLNWSWIFYINLPMVGLTYLIITSTMRAFETPTRYERIDLIGMALLIAFAGSLQLVLDLGREHDWFASGMIVSFAAVAVIGFLAFVVWELTDGHPAVDLTVLRHRSLAVAMPVMAVSYSALFGMLVLVPLWLQSVQGYTAEAAGQVMAMQGFLGVLFAPIAAAMIQRIDIRFVITLGMLIAILSTLMRAGWTTDAGFWSFAASQLVQGASIPLIFIGVMTIAMIDVPPDEVANAAGLLSFVRTVSGAAGAAVATSAWESSTRVSRSELVGTLHDVGQAGAQVPLPGDARLGLIEGLVDSQAATLASAAVYGWMILAMAVGIGLVWLMPRAIGTAGPAPAH
ncbi:MAG TPA: DHA2 family efflux MFS transporter permease subunit [Novosphingobium sp.]|nr:DHA2 family efflux MFS transporter permease subunit [Novosphingobium sp.]